jgi:hypothetical protein
MALAVLYALPDLRVAFSGPYVVQNDARQHVFWARRFEDAALFPHDLIADYFQAVAPSGYTLLYRAAAAVGLDPVLFGKLLPVALALVAVGCTFAFAARVLPHPAAAFAASALLSQHLWLTDELASGTPHAFAIPLLAAFLYLLSRRAALGCALALALQGLFYPQILLVSCGTLVLWLLRLEGGRPRLARERRDWILAAAGLAAAAASLLPFALASSRFGPTVTEGVARGMPEFFRGGRARFFDRDPWTFWIVAHRSGLLGKFFSASGPFIWAGVPMLGGMLLPILTALPRAFPLAGRVTRDAGLLARLGLASLLLFAAAHALVFRLHLPSRYAMFSIRIVLAVAAGAVLVIVADVVGRRLRRGGRAFSVLRRGLAALGIVAVSGFLALPLVQEPGGAYIVGDEPALYRFFERQPPDALVASVSPEADNIPIFSRRSVLVSRLHAVPYQLGYYRRIHSRVTDLLRAEYAEDPAELRAFVRAYGVDFILLDRWSFRPRYLLLDSWVRQYRPLVEELAGRMERGSKPALETLAEGCKALETERTIVVDATCLLR